jgi:chromosome segregation ATPase
MSETLQANRELLWDMGKSIAEKDAEIERLKLICTELARRIKDAEEAIQRQDNAIIELKALLTRAADALEFTGGKAFKSMVAELQKAAQ